MWIACAYVSRTVLTFLRNLATGAFSCGMCSVVSVSTQRFVCVSDTFPKRFIDVTSASGPLIVPPNMVRRNAFVFVSKLLQRLAGLWMTGGWILETLRGHTDFLHVWRSVMNKNFFWGRQEGIAQKTRE